MKTNFKTLNVDYKGRKYKFLVKEDVAGEGAARLQEELNKTERLLTYACYVNCEVASRAITDCMNIFFERRDVYRHKVKQYANASRKALYKTICEILSNGDEEFLDNYSANFYDLIEGDVRTLRQTMEKAFGTLKDAELLAHINLAYTLLRYCVMSYENLMRQMYERYGHDFSQLYAVYCPVAAKQQWEELTEIFVSTLPDDVDLSTDDECQKAMEVIDDKLVNHDNINKMIIAAFRELPEEKQEQYQALKTIIETKNYE